MLLKLANNNQTRPSTMKLNNRYEYNPATDLLGKGGFARVYKAQDLLLNRTVALKVFTGMGHQYSVLEEIKKAIQLDHPNLLRFYDVLLLEQTNVVGEAEQTQIGVMELANAGDLKDFARANPGSPLLYKLLKEVLLGLEYLHSQGIIHRDLKAQNILLVKGKDDQLTAKISDFGISKDTGSGGQSSSMMVGTIEYMAPEQFSPAKYGIDGKVGSNLDLWNFGIMVHELLTNTTPFGSRDGDTTAEQIMSQILSTEMPDGIDKLPEPYKSVVKKCLVTNAKERIRKASELLHYFGQDLSNTAQAQDDATRMYPKVAGTTKQNLAQTSLQPDDQTRVYPSIKNGLNSHEKPNLSMDQVENSKHEAKKIKIKMLILIGVMFLLPFGLVYRGILYSKIPALAHETTKIDTSSFKSGENFKDCAKCSEMVVIPAGSFMMGSPASEKGRNKAEGPQRTVTLKSFAMGKTEVTVAQFRRFVDAKSYLTDAERNLNGKGCFAWEASDNKFAWREGRSWRNPGWTIKDTEPVACISHNDAMAYIDWIKQSTGKSYELPSESQWEYAARAGSQTSRPWGDNLDDACKHANVADKTKNPISGSTWTNYPDCTDGYWFVAPVATYQANAYGLHDMHGNVLEWTQDVWHDNYTGAPTDGSAWLVGGNQQQRVLRGGSWGDNPQILRSAGRGRGTAGFRFNYFGFRLARAL